MLDLLEYTDRAGTDHAAGKNGLRLINSALIGSPSFDRGCGTKPWFAG